MAEINFEKQNFVPTDDNGYQLEYNKSEIGEGSNLIVEKKNDEGSYEVIQIPIKRFKESIFIVVTEPFDGRLIFE